MEFCGTTILCSGTLSCHLHGVAILLGPLARTACDTTGNVLEPVSERIVRIRLKCHPFFMSVVSLYAPTNRSNATSEAVSASEAFYNRLQDAVSSVPPSDLLVILGDSSARVGFGSDHFSWNSVIGLHGIRECNENGLQLLDFCASNQLTISNTCF